MKSLVEIFKEVYGGAASENNCEEISKKKEIIREIMPENPSC